MGTFALYVALAATPAAAFWAFALGYEWLTRYHPVAQAPIPADRSIHDLVQDLSRLGSEQRRLRHGDPPAKAARLRSVMLAYDDTLLAACLALGLPEPSEPPLHDDVRLETELALTELGLVW